MKKIIPICVALFLVFVAQSNSFAQCPGCVVNTTCHPVGGGLCPDSLPAGTQGVYYDQDITCFIPPTIDAGPFSGGVLGIVDLLSMHIDAISGLPFGLNWTCNHPGNNFAPASGDTMGCVKICGTPLSSAGVYNVTVAVTAGVDAGALGTQYGQTSFDFQMVLLANSSGNIAFNFSPSSNCDSGSFTFTPNITFPLPQLVGYNWDFGSGGVSSVSNPTPQTVNFNSPGAYPVTLTTNVYVLTLIELSANANPGGGSAWWTGDVEELCTLGCPDPDMYFSFTHGAQTYTSGTAAEGLSAIWNPLNVPLTGNAIALTVWDEDAVSADDNGGTFVTTLPGPGVYGYTTTTPLGGYTGGASGSFTISVTLDTVITVTDTVFVYASPATPTLTASLPSFCPGDSVLLTATPGYSYEWYEDDSTLIATTTTNELYVNAAGNYSVTVYDLATGCSAHSASVNVVQDPPILWTFAIQWSATNQWLQSSLTGGTISYQWQMWNGSTWVNIPAPEGVQSHYTPTGNGEFQLIAENTYGCSDTAYYNLSTFGLEDQNYISQISVYPNPTTNSFTLDLQDIKGEEVTVSIISMMGQVVYQKQFEVNGGNVNQVFDVSNYANGVYTIDINVGNFNIRKKLIKD